MSLPDEDVATPQPAPSEVTTSTATPAPAAGADAVAPAAPVVAVPPAAPVAPASPLLTADLPTSRVDASPTVTVPEVVEPPALEDRSTMPRELAGRSPLDALLDRGARSFEVPFVLVLAFGGYVVLQRRLGRGPLPMTAKLPPSVDAWRGPGDDHARYFL
jgi:hypothetical protein